MQSASTIQSASGPAVKITRKECASHTRLSLRYIDQLTVDGVLPHYRIGRAIRYDLAEVEAALRERFHVQAKERKQNAKGTRAITAR